MHLVRSQDSQNALFDFELTVHPFEGAADTDPEATILLAHEQLAFSDNCPPELSLNALKARYRHEQPFATPHEHSLLVARSQPNRSLLGAASIAIGIIPFTRARIVAMHVINPEQLTGVARPLIRESIERAMAARASSIEVEPGRDPNMLDIYSGLGFHAITTWQEKHYTLRRELPA